MKVHINYTAFRLRDDTESVARTPGAEQFFNDHDIEHKIILGFQCNDPERIEYHQSVASVEVPWYSVHMFKDMAEKYNCKFEITGDSVSVTFKE